MLEHLIINNLQKMKKTLAAILLIGILIGGYIAYTMYNKKHINVADATPAEQLSAADLFASFESDESAAMQKFADKVIGVSGAVYSLDLTNEQEPQIVLQANGDNGYIRCGFKPTELEKIKNLKSMKIGETR